MVPVLNAAAKLARIATRHDFEVFVTLALVALACALAPAAHAERIKDIATVAGVRGNQLIGYGLVVGLDGTGDQTSQTPFTIQALKNMLAQFGVLVPANVNPQLRNVAAVTVQATLAAVQQAGPNDRHHGVVDR